MHPDYVMPDVLEPETLATQDEIDEVTRESNHFYEYEIGDSDYDASAAPIVGQDEVTPDEVVSAEQGQEFAIVW